MVSVVRQMIDAGHEVILWTSRADDRLVRAVEWCEDRGLHFSAVNENAPSNREEFEAEHPNGTRKVYADIYVDDHNVEFVYARNFSNWEATVNEVAAMLTRKVLKNGKR